MKALFVIGTRPEAIKLAPVIAASSETADLDAVVLSTGQHREMLVPILEAFGVEPDFDLDVMRPNQTPTGVAARVLGAIEPILADVKPDWVVVQGDTTTVAIVGIAAFYARLRVAHVEAGLRTHVRHEPFPEEINRRLASVVADAHFAPTTASRDNLLAEGIDPSLITVTGNTVIDALQWSVKLEKTETFNAWSKRLDLDRSSANRPKLVLMTAHRRENLGAPLESICEGVRAVCRTHGDSVRFLYPVHRNPNVVRTAERLLADVSQVTLTDPLDYVSLVQIMNAADIVLTDSGGIQEEAPSLGKPVLVLREVTERPEGVEAGTAKLIGSDSAAIERELGELLADETAYRSMANAINPYGDGRASQRIIDTLVGRTPEPFA